ncbi:MAG: RNA polymerase sigma factor [Bacteroidales bacterium]|nr:RNA polymerase sigma factor [Bacteroidales bacterium]MEE0992109.1 RNA polymerase sigma factor [Bacteroidales bacterium]
MTDKEYKEQIDLHADDVLRYLAKNIKDGEVAKDILQDTFVSLWENKEKVESSKIKNWLFTVAHNNMLKLFRYNKIRQNSFIEENSSESNLENTQLIDQLLKQLPDRMRQCLMLKDWQGFSIKEISEILDISEENVKVNIFRAKVKLKELKSQL